MAKSGSQISAEGAVSRVTVLARGENPSCDYYLLPRLARMGAEVARLDTRHAPPPRAAFQAPVLIVCRYLPPAWLASVRRAAGEGATLCFFLDDDYAALIRDGALPLGYRALVAVQGLLALRLLAPRLHRLWVSTPVLQRRHGARGARLLTPVPGARDLGGADLDPPHSGAHGAGEGAGAGAGVLRFHAQLSHLGDHAFAADIVRAVLARRPDVAVEVIGPPQARALWAFAPQVRFVAEMDWPAYRARTMGVGGILIAPLLDTMLNRGRSPTKAIDAVRMGAAGLFAAGPAYAALEGVAPRLPADVAPWRDAILALLADPAARHAGAARLKAAVAGWSARAEGLDL